MTHQPDSLFAPEIRRTSTRETRTYWAVFSSARLQTGETLADLAGTDAAGETLGIAADPELTITNPAIVAAPLVVGVETIPAGRAVRYDAKIAATAEIDAAYTVRILARTTQGQTLEMFCRHAREV